MLETKNLKKIYRTKKGVSVEALKGISLKFPDTGMIFLLGKSGSGKSTLLNLLGGLDKYDEGEILIKGVSSKDFRQGHFDSYRNTYVGFIFQEYNVLEEFSVGANIALAIELQGRKAQNEEINNILRQVDLEDFGDRKPNELSGGQKQRVAIARALVKNPQIIMADEPTGALDSNTGRQVFDTLKKLSEDKLVIVVSHDREFAEYYGDRIIELSDGMVISDVERVSRYKAESKSVNSSVTVEYEVEETSELIFEDDKMMIPAGYQLTEKDREQINEYIKKLGKDLHAGIQNVEKRNFEATDQSRIKHTKSEFKLIKSKLPIKNSFKIGASSLKHKKIRLAVTIILSFVAFSLFALSDTFGNYNHIKTCTSSIIDTNIKYASVAKSVKQNMSGGYYWDDWSYKLTKSEIENLRKSTDLDFKGVYAPSTDLSLSNYGTDVKLTENENEESNLYATYFSGFAEITGDDLKKMGYKLVAGTLPNGEKDEIAISEYVYRTFEKAGYVDNKNKYSIKDYKDMVGKKLKIGGTEFTVTGIVDTKMDMERYKSVSESGTTKSSAERLKTYALTQELASIKNYSLSGAAMTGAGRVAKMIDNEPDFIEMNNFYIDISNDSSWVSGYRIAKLSDIDRTSVTWINDEKKQLGDKEVIVSSDEFTFGNEQADIKEVLEYLKNNPEYTLSYAKNDDSNTTQENGWKIVGIIDGEKTKTDMSGVYVLPDKMYEKDWDEKPGDYVYAVASMPESRAEINDLVKYCYTTRNNMRYKMQNSVTFELDSVNDVLRVLSKVFLYVGIGFAVFAALMLSNFIATSISYKKQEIGILRAIGARSNDVFRIFFAESFIIAVINFVLSCVATGIGTAVINGVIRTKGGILITVLNFGMRQVALLFVISIAVAAVASFVPVYKIASKRPIEAIRNK